MDVLSLLFGGGATGLLGTIVSQVFIMLGAEQARKDKKLSYAHEITLQQMQLTSLKSETERDVLIAEQVQATAALQGAYAHDMAYGTPTTPWVQDALKLFRPIITLVLVLLTGSIYFYTESQHIELTIVDSIIFCTISAMTFWFGDRTISKNVEDNRKLPWQ